MGQRRIALSGGGIVALHAGRAQVARCAADTLHLVDSLGKICTVPLAGGEGQCPEQAAQRTVAAILTQGGQVVASGGFAGRSGLYAKALMQLAPAPRQEPGTPQPTQAQSQPPVQQPPAQQPMAQRPTQAQSQPPAPAAPALAGSEVTRDILRRAERLFRPLEAQARMLEEPFPGRFAGAVWRRVEYPGGGYYLEGRWGQGGRQRTVHAVPGRYSPQPPRSLHGFTHYLAGADGNGYWLRLH